MIIITVKFIDGAWITVIVAPSLVLLLTQIRRHYKKIAREIKRPLELQVFKIVNYLL